MPKTVANHKVTRHTQYSQNQQNVQQRLNTDYSLTNRQFCYANLNKSSHDQMENEVCGSSVISCFRCGVNKISALLGCYPASIGTSRRSHPQASSSRKRMKEQSREQLHSESNGCNLGRPTNSNLFYLIYMQSNKIHTYYQTRPTVTK